jgi:hypothetical protein
MSANRIDSRSAIAALGDDVDVVRTAQREAHAIASQRLVIDDQDADRSDRGRDNNVRQ